MEASFLELCKMCLTEHEALPSNAREKFIHQAKVSHGFHGEGKTSFRVFEWPPMIVQCHDLRKQVLVLGAVGNDEVAPFESQSRVPVGYPLPVAGHGTCRHLCTSPQDCPGVEVMFVLRGHFGLIHGGVHEAVRGLHGHHHDAPVIGH